MLDILVLLAASSFSAQETQTASCNAQENFTLVVHGGTARAGQVPEARLVFMRKMLSRARRDLRRGAHAVDVVEDVVSQMEDSGLFNAGQAAITNRDGFVETDASIMDGRNLEAGSVASMRFVKNPIRAARLVMDETRHVMMVGDRGEAAVTALGAETVPATYFIRNKTEKDPKEHGTVGAAVLDRCGNLAAGTSTGGYDAKIPGRVGDSPNIGAGVFAKNGVMAGSATGHGEYFIRYTALRSVAARMEYGGQALSGAAEAVITEMDKAGEGRDGRGGIITVDAEGNVAMPFSTDGMVRGVVSNEAPPAVGVFGSMN